MDHDTPKFSQTNQPILTLREETSALLSAIIESSDDAIISKTLHGIITSWNPAAEKLFGFTSVEAIGQHITMIIPSERLKEEDFIISQVSQGNQVNHFETMRQRKDGSLVNLSISVSPIRDSTGKIIGASKIARNITEQRKAAERQSMLAAIVDTSDDTILSKTLDGIITSWNKAAEKMFGYTEAEAVGKHISLIIPADRLNEEDYIIGEIRKGNKVDHFQTIRQAKDGHLVPISVSVSPITDLEGKVIGASKIARDISVQQADEEEKKQLYEQIKKLNEKKDEFIGLASHELKTPLTSINGYLHILERMITDEKALQFLKKSQHQVKKLSTLVSDLLDISKIEAGKLQISIENLNIREIVDDAIGLLSHTHTQYRITLYSDVKELNMQGDPGRIEQVIINLLTNAIRYSPGTNQIEVFLEQHPGKVKIGVKDFGVGIAADKLKHIFSRFYRVDDVNPNISGLGIGLYLSHQIVSRHNGEIWADSQPGVGSTFWFTLPLL
ncbi:PAS domain-containing sensor histidine kinase [Mucilaginibacter sp. HMF5004]|uniref:sensor histidine kinase n=1 Tax=Mucilaginibacter rivuli TaxID=2857527 RepID=UPI001C5FEFE2|nr:PAS domain-containing sensor histidine kinase [Mucilaginibacter rivuli]MBW4888420.1 PAS domain-containing sensor histidine kinase [Mucilaginibacter rivuli]